MHWETLRDAAILGAIQGLTEFLPVSSSGHLVLAQQLFTSLATEESGVILEVLLHLATLVAVLVYYRRDLVFLIKAIVQPAASDQTAEYRRLGLGIIVATIITGIIGVAFKDRIEALFAEPAIVGGLLLVTAVHLLASDYIRREKRSTTSIPVWVAVVVGLAQSLALFPGISRSGMTITWGLFLGIERAAATRFAFLLSIPAISAAAVFTLKDADLANLSGDLLWPYALGMLVAGVIGYLTISLLVRLIAGRSLWPFAAYCSVVGVLALTFL